MKGAGMFSATATAPDRGALSGPLAGISFIAGIGGANALADQPYPRPSSEPSEVRRFFSQNPGPVRLSAAGQIISAASLARFTASVARLAGRSGRGSRALQTAAVARGGFLAGGVIHSPAFGVLLGALGLAGLRTGELPRPVAITALASAAACLLAPLYLVAEPFAWFLPAGRFPGLVVSGIAGVQLARGGQSGP